VAQHVVRFIHQLDLLGCPISALRIPVRVQFAHALTVRPADGVERRVRRDLQDRVIIAGGVIGWRATHRDRAWASG